MNGYGNGGTRGGRMGGGGGGRMGGGGRRAAGGAVDAAPTLERPRRARPPNADATGSADDGSKVCSPTPLAAPLPASEGGDGGLPVTTSAGDLAASNGAATTMDAAKRGSHKKGRSHKPKPAATAEDVAAATADPRAVRLHPRRAAHARRTLERYSRLLQAEIFQQKRSTRGRFRARPRRRVLAAGGEPVRTVRGGDLRRRHRHRGGWQRIHLENGRVRGQPGAEEVRDVAVERVQHAVQPVLVFKARRGDHWDHRAVALLWHDAQHVLLARRRSSLLQRELPPLRRPEGVVQHPGVVQREVRGSHATAFAAPVRSAAGFASLARDDPLPEGFTRRGHSRVPSGAASAVVHHHVPVRVPRRIQHRLQLRGGG